MGLPLFDHTLHKPYSSTEEMCQGRALLLSNLDYNEEENMVDCTDLHLGLGASEIVWSSSITPSQLLNNVTYQYGGSYIGQSSWDEGRGNLGSQLSRARTSKLFERDHGGVTTQTMVYHRILWGVPARSCAYLYRVYPDFWGRWYSYKVHIL